MTDTDDLAAWLRTTLDRVEQVALAASGGGVWHYSGTDSVGAWTLYDEDWTIADLKTYRHESYDYAKRMPTMRHPAYIDADANGTHVAFWQPHRVLRLVEATRRILDLGQEFEVYSEPYTAQVLWERTLRLAAVWLEDQPGYRESWKP
jgi:hypothetical protein